MEDVPDFGLVDFMPEIDYRELFDLINDDTSSKNANFECGKNIAGLFDYESQNQVVFPDLDFTSILDPDDCALINSSNVMEGEEEFSDNPTTPATPCEAKNTSSEKKTTTDRSRTLNSERRRRGTMKEKLYALRALVPNITKMDKASIVGDSMRYVQELQSKAEVLRTEIAGLEASSETTSKSENRPQEVDFAAINHQIIKQIMQMNVAEMGDYRFHVRLVCQKGLGVAASLYKVLESFTSFTIQSSNLISAENGAYILTFSIRGRESNDENITMPDVKLSIATAFLNEGFDFEKSIL